MLVRKRTLLIASLLLICFGSTLQENFKSTLNELGYVKHPGCVDFVPVKPDERSIVFSEASGRLGNNLLVYAMLLQVGITLGLDAYINDECLQHLQRFFKPESIKLKSLQQTYCNYNKVSNQSQNKNKTY